MSGRIPQTTIDDILSRTDIIEIIQPRISLVKKGQNYQARCPFHDEKTPSFTVSQNKQFYYCFGCGAHGNAIGFLMNYDRMEFLDAITYLATQAGIELQREDTPAADPNREKLYPLMEKIAALYQKALRHSNEAIDYLKTRGLTGQTAKHFAIGFAPESWDTLTKQFDTESLVTTGMTIRKDNGKTYDRFRHRIMFPIRDIRGRVIAYGGRSLGDDLPKYLNSPETTIFHKSNELYGLYEARKSNSQLNRLLIVEGYMDVIVLAQYDLQYAVATLGTAINAKHIQKCLRYTNELVFCFDGDNAGRQAAWKALTIALPLLRDDIQIRFLFLPEKEDPDSLIQKIGKAAFESLIQDADSLSDVFFETLSQQIPITSMESKAHYAHEAMKYINTMPKGIFYQLIEKELAKRLSMSANDLNRLDQQEHKKQKTNKQSSLNPAQLASSLLLQSPTLATQVNSLKMIESIDIDGKSMLLFLLKQFQLNPELTTGKLLASSLKEEQKRRIAEMAAIEFPFDHEGLQTEFQGAMQRLNELYIKKETDYLIKKAKTSSLTDEEKKILQNLLTQKEIRE